MKKHTIKKIILITFLAFVVVGFTAPLIDFSLFEDTSTTNLPPQLENPKLCTSDNDCTLTCGKPIDPILCIQNICAQTECDQDPLYYYSQVPITFNLQVAVENKSLPLIVDPNNIFVNTTGDKTSVFSPSLPIIAVLEKMGITFTQNCMVYRTVQYCQDETHELIFKVNGKDSNLGYIASNGDKIYLTHQQIETITPLLNSPVENSSSVNSSMAAVN